MEYTKGEWKVKYLPITKQPAIYAGDELIAGGLTEANAHRIVDCWNGCEGINPLAVKDLYEALKIAAELLTIGISAESLPVPYIIEQALTKAEGEK